MNAIDATIPSRRLTPGLELQRGRTAARSVRQIEARRGYRAECARRSRAWVGLTIAIVAGALMMIAAFMSASGLQHQAWEKEQTQVSAPQPPQVAPAPAGGTYVTEPAVTTQP